MKSLSIILISLLFNPQVMAQEEVASQVQTFPVHFAYNSAEMVRPSKIYIKRLARALAKNRNLFERIELVGHSDQTGKTEFNSKLSEMRAMAVADRLMEAGLNGAKIRAIAKGGEEPMLVPKFQPNLLVNRRVELKFIGVKDDDALEKVLDRVNR